MGQPIFVAAGPVDVVPPYNQDSPSYGLRQHSLSPLETLAQSISTIAPTTSPTMTIPLVFALAGNGTWLAYLFATLAILLMALFLLRGCEQAREKLTRHRDETPLAAPVATPSQTVHLALASDANGSITVVERDVALPEEATARARALLGRLIAEYSYKNYAPPLESGPAIDDVFLLDLPLRPAGANPADQASSLASDALTAEPRVPGGQLAVVNTPPASSPKPSPSTPSWAPSTQTSPASNKSASSSTAVPAIPSTATPT